MTENHLTARDVAKRIALSDDRAEIDFVARQVRHWTNEGLLQAVGDLHPGAGRARRYSQRAVYIAAFLTELTRYKMPVGVMFHFIAWLLTLSGTIRKQRGYDPFDIAVEGKRKRPVYLWVYWEQTSVNLTYESQGELDPKTLDLPSDASSIIVLNLSQIFGRVRR